MGRGASFQLAESDARKLEAYATNRTEPTTFLDDLKAVAARLTDADRNTIRTLAASLHELGEIQREGQQERCVAAYEEALSVAEQIGDRPVVVTPGVAPIGRRALAPFFAAGTGPSAVPLTHRNPNS